MMRFPKSSDNTAHIVYASDDKFAGIMGASLISLYENSKDMDDIVVYILDNSISKENKQRIEQISRKYNRHNILWIQADNMQEKLSIRVEIDRGSLAQYARLFIASSLPDGVKRILYLDCDTVVRYSIRELWNLELNNKIAGVLMDAFSKFYRMNIELSENDIMFNSGVMLIDLDKWKNSMVEEKICDFIIRHRGKLQQGDQGVLNAVLSNNVYCFEPRFNAVTIFFDFSYSEMMLYRRPPSFYSKDQIQEAVENPVIVHFTTSFMSKRVWIQGSRHQYSREWMMYRNMSPWRDRPLLKDNRSCLKRGCLYTLNHMPRWLVIRLAAIIQIYGRPIFYRLKILMYGERI